jgi:hypothetical protein
VIRQIHPRANPRFRISERLGWQAPGSTLIVQRGEGTFNYFIGNEPKKWHTGIPTFGKVRYRDVY